MKPRGLERSRVKGATPETIDIYFTELERKLKKIQPHKTSLNVYVP